MKDFLTLVRRPTDLIRSLRRIAVGGMIAAAGTGAATPASAATELPATPPAISPNIVDRSKKAAKFVLQLPGSVGFLGAEHRSHRSHSSHRSHYSSAGGGASAPAPAPRPAPTPAPRPAPVREAAAAATVLDLTQAEANTITAEIVTVASALRTVTVRQTATSPRMTFGFRDDTTFQTTPGLSVRFDDFAEANSGRLPIKAGDKVEFQWRTSADGKAQIITTILRKP